MNISTHIPSAKIITYVLTAILVLGTLGLSAPATALDGSDFTPGNIIDDSVFYDSQALSVVQIQNFLDAKVPVCDTNGDKLVSSGQTRAEYSAERGNPAPFTCLKDYTEDTTAITNSGSDLCGGSISGGTKSAAQIIYDVGQACGINPQVLIVLLQKEQALITDDWPWQTQYDKATGYGCPDTAPCDEQYFGFKNQVYQAAQAFRRYEANPFSYNFRAGRDNYIGYHPNTACGGSTVYIENQATANLYIYTPYQPNQSALDNLYGSGDSCGAYGNRNFWRMFTDWFGSTRAESQFITMQTPRWMTTKTDTQRIDLSTSQPTGDLIPQGTELYFDEKITIDNVLYLRTSEDSSALTPYAIPFSELQEFTLNFVPMQTPRWLQIDANTRKTDPATGQARGATIPPDHLAYFTSKTTVGGVLYLRTGYDTTRSNTTVIAYSRLTEVETEPEYTSFTSPRRLTSKRDSFSRDLTTMSDQTTAPLQEGSTILFNTKIIINNITYIRMDAPSDTTEFSGYPLQDFSTFQPSYTPMTEPREMRLINETKKLNPITGAELDPLFEADRKIKFSDKIIIDDELYLRTQYDSTRNIDRVLLYSSLKELWQ